MVKRQGDNYPRNINTYVPLMQFAADIQNEQVYASLGAPAALNAAGILSLVAVTSAGNTFTSATPWATTFDGSSTSLTRTVGKLDAPFGRCLSIVSSNTNVGVITITGRDYLGQPMAESLTSAGATPVVGKKAFKYVDKIVSVGGSSVNLSVGWTDVLGLPYKSLKLRRASEDGVFTDDEGETATLLNAGYVINGPNNSDFVAPFDGYWVGWYGTLTTAETGAADALTTFVNAVAKTALNGSCPVASIGLQFGKDAARASWIPVLKGDTCRITSDGGGSAGVADMVAMFSKGVCEFNKAINTSPQTTTTGDPRGTYKPLTACNGVIVHEVHLVVDITNLHGVAQAAS